MLDANVLIFAQHGEALALKFLERNAGRLYINNRIIGEFLDGAPVKLYRQFARKFGIRELDSFESLRIAFMAKLHKTTKKTVNDVSAIVTARQYSLRIVSGDEDIVSLSLRSGYTNVAARRLKAGTEKHDPIRWYKKLRKDIPSWSDVNPFTITGSPNR